MSLDSTTVAEAPASGQETATANPAPTNENDSRYEGFSSPDAPEAEAPNPVETATEAQPADPDAEAQADVEGDANESAEPENDEPQSDDPFAGYEDFEFEGKAYKIPSELKDGYLRAKDYYKKTTAVAERGRELDAREASITERQKLSDQEVDAQLALIQVGSQLKKFENINWNEERAKVGDDPIARGELNTLWQEFQDLRSLHAEGVAYLNNAAQQRTEHAKQETANRHAATEAWAAKNIKGWGADLHKQIVTWAGEQGLDEATLKQAYTPQVYSILNKAFQWDQSLKRQQSAKPNPVTPQVKPSPTTNVSAKGNVVRTFDAETASMDDYAADWKARQKRR